jgi:hypothetical protein
MRFFMMVFALCAVITMTEAGSSMQSLENFFQEGSSPLYQKFYPDKPKIFSVKFTVRTKKFLKELERFKLPTAEFPTADRRNYLD